MQADRLALVVLLLVACAALSHGALPSRRVADRNQARIEKARDSSELRAVHSSQKAAAAAAAAAAAEKAAAAVASAERRVVRIAVDESVAAKPVREPPLPPPHAVTAIDDVLRDKLEGGFLQAARRRVASSPTNKVYFYHVHKGAGTHFLTVAKQLGLEPAVQWTHTQKLSMSAVFHNPQMVVAEKRTRLASNEHYLLPADRMPWDVYQLFVTTARHPVERLHSHYLHVMKTKDGRAATLPFVDWVRLQPDNFFVRRFCGAPCRDVPRGQLTADHLRQALDNLYRFDVVISTESFAQGIAVVAQLLKLNGNASAVSMRDRQGKHTKANLNHLSRAEMDMSFSVCDLDMVFYRHASFIADSIVDEKLIEEAFLQRKRSHRLKNN